MTAAVVAVLDMVCVLLLDGMTQVLGLGQGEAGWEGESVPVQVCWMGKKGQD